MADQNEIVELWYSRKRSFTKEIIPYLRYMAQSGFPAFLSLISIVSIIQYISLINNVPPNLPIAWIGAIVLTPFLSYSPLRTYLQHPDLIFLMPAEHQLAPYIKLSSKRSFRNSLLLLMALVLIFWPLYRQSEGYIGLWLVVVLIILKSLNSYFAWQERRLNWNSTRMLLRILRWLLMFVVVLSWLMHRNLIVELVLTVAVAALLFVIYRRLGKFDFPWQRLIDEEKATLRRLFAFFNWFIDVQGAPPIVKPRRYMAWLIKTVKYSQSNTFSFLHIITFVRTEIGGICVRLLLLGGLILYLFAAEQGLNGWGVVVSYVIAGMLISLQIGTLRKTHRHAIWRDIFPLQTQLQHKQLIAVERMLNYVTLALLLLPTIPMWGAGGTQLVAMLVFLALYPIWRSRRLAVRLKKEDEDDF